MKKLISGILFSAISFLFVSCSGPQTNTLTAKGAYAVDFSAAPSAAPDNPGFIGMGQSIPSLKGKELTIEAWIKVKKTPLLGSIFIRASAYEGIMLWIDDEARASFIMRVSPTINFYVVRSATAINKQDAWYHIAAVQANTDHSDVHPLCGAPHMDIYVDGNFENCAASQSTPEISYRKNQDGTPKIEDGSILYINEMIGRAQVTGNWGDGLWWYWPTGIGLETRLDAVIDEVRFWSKAKTQEEIQKCMNQELGIKGDCMITANLIGYWRLNEGTGSDHIDSSGSGNGGGKYYCNYKCEAGEANAIPWDGGWVAGDWK